MSQDQTVQELKTVKAQLEAHKGMLNEQLQMSLNLRTNLVMFQQALQEANQKIAELTPKPAAPVVPESDGA